jgi:hypothetical protein
MQLNYIHYGAKQTNFGLKMEDGTSTLLTHLEQDFPSSWVDNILGFESLAIFKLNFDRDSGYHVEVF